MCAFQPEIKTNDPNTTGWGLLQRGVLWFNSTSGVWKYWDGNSIRTINSTDDNGDTVTTHRNVLPIPSGTVDSGWFYTDLDTITTWGDYYTAGRLTNVDTPNISSLDSTVLYNGKYTIRHGNDKTPRDSQICHITNYWIYLTPGDHIIFNSYIKANPDSQGYRKYTGAIIGIDLYAEETPYRIWEVAPQESGNDEDNFDCLYGNPKSYDYEYVSFGTDNWTFMELDFTVPTWQFTIDDYGTKFPSQYINGGIPWIGASWNHGESAAVWFADIKFYINRNGVWY